MHLGRSLKQQQQQQWNNNNNKEINAFLNWRCAPLWFIFFFCNQTIEDIDKEMKKKIILLFFYFLLFFPWCGFLESMRAWTYLIKNVHRWWTASFPSKCPFIRCFFLKHIFWSRGSIVWLVESSSPSTTAHLNSKSCSTISQKKMNEWMRNVKKMVQIRVKYCWKS